MLQHGLGFCMWGCVCKYKCIWKNMCGIVCLGVFVCFFLIRSVNQISMLYFLIMHISIICDQTVEERSTVKDSNGCTKETITRRIGDSSHTITTITDQDGRQERRETVNNADRGKTMCEKDVSCRVQCEANVAWSGCILYISYYRNVFMKAKWVKFYISWSKKVWSDVLW